MSITQHGFSAEEWVDLVEGLLGGERYDGMLFHIAGCEACRRTRGDLELAHAHLEELSRRLTASAGVPDDSAARTRQAVLARVRIAEAVLAGSTMAVAVGELREILRPLCGVPTTESAIRSAALKCSLAGSEKLGRRQGVPFVGHLSTTIEVMCGTSVAEWIAETTRDIDWGATA